MTTKEELLNTHDLTVLAKTPVKATTVNSIDEGDKVVDNGKKDFINPDFYNTNDVSLIWIDIKAIPIYKLTNNIRAGKTLTTNTNTVKASEALAIQMNAPVYTFKFLASNELIEQISHSWESYNSFASDFAQSFAQYGFVLPEQAAGLIASTGEETLKGAFSKVGESAVNLVKNSNSAIIKTIYQTGLKALASAAISGTVANYRVDTPLQYKGSERRTFELIFNLINTKTGKNHENVVLPVKLLEMFSSPSYGTIADNKANSDIILPYLFEVKTSPGDLMNIDLAVLKNVQPTWKGPWIGGYPSRCELRLSFMEYRTLEQKVFYGTSSGYDIITAIQKERSDATDSIIDSKLRNIYNKEVY
jgi:hypothetical protein